MRSRPQRPTPGLLADLAIALLLCVTLAVAVRPWFDAPGSPFDEGFSLAYPVRVLQGDVPHRDFETFYGPGNPWLLAGAFAVAGTSQGTERALGVLYQLLLVLAAAGVARAAAGRWAALLAGAVAIALLTPLVLYAYAGTAALGCALAAIAALAASWRRAGTVVVPAAAAGGLLAGATLLMRPDHFIALVLPAVVLLAGGGRSRLTAFLSGLAPAVLALAVHAAIVGPGRLSRVISDMLASGPGRRLPFDPLSAGAGVAEPSRLLVLAIVVAATGLAVALTARRRPAADEGWRFIAAVSLLTLGLVPYALTRVDYVHVVVVLLPALVLIPPTTALIARSARARLLVAVIAGALLLTSVLAVKTLRASLTDRIETILARQPPPPSAPVRVGPRRFSVAPETAPAIQRILDAAERERRSGARTLIVGPGDLRRAFGNDVYLYYLLADLRPATYYMEFNPLAANSSDSGLAGDVRRADLLILNSAYDRPGEANDSRRNGPQAPNHVVSREFCPVVSAGTLRLLRRCDR